MAAAWLDEREPALLHVARGVGRPLWVGAGRDGMFFASTRTALEVLEGKLAKRGVALAALDRGAVEPAGGGRARVPGLWRAG